MGVGVPRRASAGQARSRVDVEPIAVLRRLNGSRLARVAGPLRALIARLAWLVVEARLVRESGRYVLNSARVSRAPRGYHLRSTGERVWLRHHTGDVAILRKFEAYHYYDFPPPVAEKLNGRAISVVDLGANIGLFGLHASAQADVSRMVSFEPDAENVALLERIARGSGIEWELVAACASSRDGEVTFAGGRANLSRIAETGTPVPMVDAVPYLLSADLAKVNIEGAEWEILTDPRFVAGAPEALIIEYHDIATSSPDIHALAEQLLSAAGYVHQSVVNRSESNGLVWAWKDSSIRAAA